MRLEDMRDRKACFARHIDINIDIRSWIENRSDPFVIVTEEVGKLRDAFSLNGLKNEGHDQDFTAKRRELQLATASPSVGGQDRTLAGKLWENRLAACAPRKKSAHLDRNWE